MRGIMGSLNASDHETIVVSLIVLLAVALGAGALLVRLVRGWLRDRRASNSPPDDAFTPLRRGYQSAIYDLPHCWLAIRTSNLAAVQDSLKLHNPIACSWEEGLAEARGRKLFISPPIQGWVLVIGSALPEASEDIDQCFRFLMALSRKTGLVQYFSVNRILRHHAWAIVDEGEVVRGYAWADQTLWNQGPRTAAEAQLGMHCFRYTETPDRTLFGESDPAASNTEKVYALAAKWSLDPASLDDRVFKASHGIAGRWPSKLH
jgi:hypothetical protein